jgi:hypothetical protein
MENTLPSDARETIIEIKAILVGTRATSERNLPVLFIHWRLSEVKKTPGSNILVIVSILPKTKSIKLH